MPALRNAFALFLKDLLNGSDLYFFVDLINSGLWCPNYTKISFKILLWGYR